MTQQQRQRALLGLLFGTTSDAASNLAALMVDDWQALMPLIGEHRLGPLLHWQLQQHRESPSALSEDQKTRLADAFKRSAVRGLLLQAELVRLHRLLTNAGIPYAALKGAFVAFAAYPHCAMRPLRDLDILVPEELALQAFELLQREGGYCRSDYGQGNPEIALQIAKHLPPLRHASRNINVEVHHRLLDPNSACRDLAADTSLWNRLCFVPISQQRVAVLSPTDNLLHLIVHAAYDHHFNNGPLVLSDIHYLLQHGTIDWALFWHRAQACAAVKGCQLTLATAQHLDATLPVKFAAKDYPEECVLDDALNLLLRSFANRGAAAVMGEIQQGGGQRWRGLVSRVLPSRMVMASRYPVAPNSVRLWFYYPVLWKRLIQERLPAISRNIFSRQTHAEVARLRRVRAWMEH